MSDFAQTFDRHFQSIQKFIEEHWQPLVETLDPGLKTLIESIQYSSLEGGKRFRPVLSCLVAEALDRDAQLVIPYAVSVELIHTYSLIHDDLPVMDNDDFRRGRPTNHKVFGEATALLAGDALLTEAFDLISTLYAEDPRKAVQLVRILSSAAGVRGMVGGQATDLLAKTESLTLKQLVRMHEMKTGALIMASVQGAAVISDASSPVAARLTEFARLVGLAFQVADDLLDSKDEKIEPGSFPALLGLTETRRYLEELTGQAFQQLDILGAKAENLKAMARYNLERKK